MKGLEGPTSLSVAILALHENKDDVRGVTCASHLRIFYVPEEAAEPSPGITSPRAVCWHMKL
jgi:hypothetical protein